jgi:putative hydrolase of the HAD superfamily
MGAFRNVVFDMGGVLLRWDPQAIAAHFARDENDARLLADAVFGDPSWTWLDAGVVEEETVVWLAQRKLPERLRPVAEEMVYHWYDGRGFIEETKDLACRLADSGTPVFLLTNAGPAFPRYCERIPAWPHFSGVLVSYRERLLKPDARIYRLLLERFGLSGPETLFVDDLEQNVEGAVRAGMRGFHFTGDAAELEAYLQKS